MRIVGRPVLFPGLEPNPDFDRFRGWNGIVHPLLDPLHLGGGSANPAHPGQHHAVGFEEGEQRLVAADRVHVFRDPDELDPMFVAEWDRVLLHVLVGPGPFPVPAGWRSGIGEHGIVRKFSTLNSVEQHRKTVKASAVAEKLDQIVLQASENASDRVGIVLVLRFLTWYFGDLQLVKKAC